MVLSTEPNKLQALLDRLSDSVTVFRIRFEVLAQSKILLWYEKSCVGK